MVSGYQRSQPCVDGSSRGSVASFLHMERRLIIPQPTAESTFDYILPKAALKASTLIPLLCLFSHNQEWLLFANDNFNFFSLFPPPPNKAPRRQPYFVPLSGLNPTRDI